MAARRRPRDRRAGPAPRALEGVRPAAARRPRRPADRARPLVAGPAHAPRPPAGRGRTALRSRPADALGLLAISPGGPGTGAGLLLIGIVLAALAALLRTDRAFAVRTAWAAALAGLLLAVLVNRTGWAGPATLVYGLALLAAAALGADGARERVAARSFGWRQPLAALIALTAAVGPLFAAATWMLAGADGPLQRRDPVQVPAFVADAGGDDNQTRTLILDLDPPASVSYSLVRGSGGRIGDAEITARTGGDARLDKVVSNSVAYPEPTSPASSAPTPSASSCSAPAAPTRSAASSTPPRA